ncbi:hypothetical protein PG990_006672 [Apiospora arundinis]
MGSYLPPGSSPGVPDLSAQAMIPHARKAPASPTRLVLISSHEADNLCFCFFPQYSAAKYYRLAEQNGNKTLGNTWVSSSVIGAARGLQNGRRR